MKPVDQTVFGMPHGNCLMACVASILEVPLDSLPVLFDEIEKKGRDENDWWAVLLDALRPHGFTAIYYPNDTVGYPAIAPTGYHIASGHANRGFRHAVVHLDGKLAHDPHPSREGTNTVERYYLIVPLAKPVSATPSGEVPSSVTSKNND